MPALAHPLGNFTINHLSVLGTSPNRVELRYVLDEAEIPSFAVLREAGVRGPAGADFLRLWSAQEAHDITPQLHVRLDGQAAALVLDNAKASSRPGAGGLATLYWQANFHVARPAGARELQYEDTTFPGRLGWKDVVLRPAHEPTDELRHYPSVLIGSPRDTTNLRVNLQSGVVGAAAPAAGASAAAVSAARSNQLSDLLARGTSDWRVVMLTFLVAIGLGALHALEPGHGKTLLAVSLVGARATPKQAIILAGSLTFAHTIGVLLLGLVILVGARYIVPELIYPWITLGSGIVIAVLGARALARYVARRRPVAHAHTHTHDHAHPHEHVHSHAHDGAPHHHHGDLDDVEHARLHAEAFAGPLTFRGVVLAAMSGGIAPCPAALVVLLTALSLHQVAYGLAIIVAFSFGLAGILTGLGIAVVRGAAWLSARQEFDRFVKLGPLFSALIIALIGSVMVGQGFAQSGVSAPWLVVTALTIVAIAAYALVPHTHGSSSQHFAATEIEAS